VLGELPSAGDSVKVPGYTIAVTEMDGRRIARLRVTPAPRPAPAAGPAPGSAGHAPSGTTAGAPSAAPPGSS
jgi:putative hemolysin